MPTPPANTRAFIAVLAVITALGPLSMQIILPVLPVMQVAFEVPEEGKVQSLTLYQSGMEVKMPRVEADPSLPKVEEILALRKKAKWLDMGNSDHQRITGTVVAGFIPSNCRFNPAISDPTFRVSGSINA